MYNYYLNITLKLFEGIREYSYKIERKDFNIIIRYTYYIFMTTSVFKLIIYHLHLKNIEKYVYHRKLRMLLLFLNHNFNINLIHNVYHNLISNYANL